MLAAGLAIAWLAIVVPAAQASVAARPLASVTFAGRVRYQVTALAVTGAAVYAAGDG